MWSLNDLSLTHFYHIIVWKILEFTYSANLQFQAKKVGLFSFFSFFLYLINEFYLIRKSFKMLGLLSWRIKSSIYRQNMCSFGTRGVNPPLVPVNAFLSCWGEAHPERIALPVQTPWLWPDSWGELARRGKEVSWSQEIYFLRFNGWGYIP